MTAMKPPPDRDWLLHCPTEARVQRIGRFSYAITIAHDGMQSGPWFAIGTRAHAEAKARRLFRRHLRQRALRSEVVTITADDVRGELS